jgi:hypothetical protein
MRSLAFSIRAAWIPTHLYREFSARRKYEAPPVQESIQELLSAGSPAAAQSSLDRRSIVAQSR